MNWVQNHPLSPVIKLGIRKEWQNLSTKRWLTCQWTVYTTPLTTLTTDLGLSIRVSTFEYVRLVTGTSSPGMGEGGDW